MEYAEKGDLEMYIKSRKEKGLLSEKKVSILKIDKMISTLKIISLLLKEKQ